MNQTRLEEVAKMAASEAVKDYGKSIQKNRRLKIFQNTKKLMENYNRICQSVEEGISELNEVPVEENIGDFMQEDIFIDSITRSKLRSIVMLAHIDKCLKLLQAEEYRKNTPEKYLAFTYYYLDEMKPENIEEVLNCTDRTVRRWISELTGILGVYLFGSDAIMLE